MGVLLSYANWTDAAAEIVCASEAPGLGLRALLTPQIADVWRSDGWGATTITLDVDLGENREVRLAAIAAPRDGLLPSAAATVRLKASTIGIGGVNALDTGAVALGMTSNGATWAWCGDTAPITARWFRFEFAGTADDAYLQLGRLWIGPALVTASAVAYGWRESSSDSGITTRSALSGVRDARVGRGARVAEWPLGRLTTPEADLLRAIAVEMGSTRQVFAARHHEAPSAGFFASFTAPPSVQRVSYPVWASALSIIEDL